MAAALDPSYLAVLKKRQTNPITLRLNKIIDFLFRNYGCVTPAKLVNEEQYLHATLYIPTKTTLLKVVCNGHFLTWPGLTIANVGKLLDEISTTVLGHLDQEKQCLQSSKWYIPDTDDFPLQEVHQTHDAIAAIVPPITQSIFWPYRGASISIIPLQQVHFCTLWPWQQCYPHISSQNT